MLWRHLLIFAAIVVALILSVNKYLTSHTLGSLRKPAYSASNDKFPYTSDATDLTARCFPFPWQKVQQERLYFLLQPPRLLPTGTDELALARFVQYAEMHEYEQIFREGLRHEPHNALYHYLLADMYIQQSLRGEEPSTDKQSGAVRYHYTITDRHKLDMGMQELALGLALPLYLLYIAIPVISWRDQGYPRAEVRFNIGVGVFWVWTLLVTPTMAAFFFQQRSIVADLLIVEQRWHSRFVWMTTLILSFIWAMLAWNLLLYPLSAALLKMLFVHSSFSNCAEVVRLCICGVVLLTSLRGDWCVIPWVYSVKVQEYRFRF